FLVPFRLICALLHRRDRFFGGLVRRLRVHPQDELVERHARDGREVLPVEGHPGVQRGREEVRERDDDRIRVAVLAIHVRARPGGYRHQPHQTEPGREMRELSLHRNSLLGPASSNKAGPDASSRPAPSPVTDVRIASAYFTSTAALLASRRRNGITAGISHFCHMSSTLDWK